MDGALRLPVAAPKAQGTPDNGGHTMSEHTEDLEDRRVTRRRFIQGAGATAAAAGLGALGPIRAAGASAPAGGRAGTINIGYVTPSTGPLAPFGEADNFVLSTVRRTFRKGIKIGGETWSVKITSKDSQSDPDRAANVASELILQDGIDLMLVSSTPETTNPVADICEANGQPCVSSVAPWQPYFVGRGGDPTDPESGFDWTYHFFWGLEDISAVFLDMWTQVSTNNAVAGLFPNDGDGQAWSDAQLAFSKPISGGGYTITNPGLYPNGNDNFSSQIQAFRGANAEVLTGVPQPPDFTTFWTQARQQGFIPKIASVGKALLFPSSVEALGGAGENLSTEVWWSPTHPFKSSLTGQTAKELADAYEKRTGKQWTQPIGFAHALFEVANDVFKRSRDPKDKDRVARAIRRTNLDTIVGKIDWGARGVPKNVAKTPLVGGQWVTGGGRFPYDLIVVSNKDHTNIPKAGDLKPIPGS
jgi:branched-chain amino acid transport system substrate-binding protein